MYSYRSDLAKPSNLVAYQYDADSNRTSMIQDGQTTSYTYDQAGRMLNAGEESYTYYANGNMTGRNG
jgi:hypothetical protein